MASSILESVESLGNVEILDLRHYGSADLRPLLEREAADWARSMDWDYRASAEMILRYIDSRVLPGYVALEQGRVSGYAFYVYEGQKGVIGDVYADVPPPQSQEVNLRLLESVIGTLKASPGVRRIESQLLAHESGAVSEAFLREGFKVFPRIFMALPLHGLQSGTSREDEGEVVLRPWHDHDFHPAAQVIHAAYQGHIDASINDQYRTHSGSLRFLNNIVRFPGCGIFEPLSSSVAIHRRNGRMVGLLLCSRVNQDVGHVTQVCVTPDFRGAGVGRRLLQRCARDLAARGFRELSLTVTDANSRAVGIYHRTGYATRRFFDAFVWEG